MTLVAGVDSSTQSTKVVVVDADTGATVREGKAPHPPGTETPPAAWWEAWHAASSGGLLDGVEALAVSAQQHGMVALDAAGDVVRPALLWNDVRSAPDAADLIAELGGAQAWADAVGLVPVASFTVTKLRWLARCEPDHAEQVERVVLPHDWLTWRLTGAAAEPVTDRGDASGTGYWSPRESRYRDDLLRLALGREAAVPRVLGPGEPAGTTPDGVVVAVGTGDNMGAALGLGAGPGDVVVSIGTSGTATGTPSTPGASSWTARERAPPPMSSTRRTATPWARTASSPSARPPSSPSTAARARCAGVVLASRMPTSRPVAFGRSGVRSPSK